MGIGFVPVLSDELSVNAHVELAMRAGDELEGADVLTHPAECFTCHPGSSQGMSSVMAVKYL